MTTSSGGSAPGPGNGANQSNATAAATGPNTSSATTTAATRGSLTARLAPQAGLLATAGLPLSLLSVRLGVLTPIGAFLSFALFLIVGALTTLCLSIAGLIATRAARGKEGRSSAWAGAALGGGLLAILVVLAAGAADAPGIHDITTDIADPPSFAAALQVTDTEGRDLTYPHGGTEVPALQRQHYPDIAPVHLDLTMPAAMEAAARVASELGWTVLDVDKEAGRLKAYDVTRYFRFVDDVVVRVRPRSDGPGVRIDLRSTSRVGRSDLGANAARIREFAAALRGSGP